MQGGPLHAEIRVRIGTLPLRGPASSSPQKNQFQFEPEFCRYGSRRVPRTKKRVRIRTRPSAPRAPPLHQKNEFEFEPGFPRRKRLLNAPQFEFEFEPNLRRRERLLCIKKRVRVRTQPSAPRALLCIKKTSSSSNSTFGATSPPLHQKNEFEFELDFRRNRPLLSIPNWRSRSSSSSSSNPSSSSSSNPSFGAASAFSASKNGVRVRTRVSAQRAPPPQNSGVSNSTSNFLLQYRASPRPARGSTEFEVCRRSGIRRRRLGRPATKRVTIKKQKPQGAVVTTGAARAS